MPVYAERHASTGDLLRGILAQTVRRGREPEGAADIMNHTATWQLLELGREQANEHHLLPDRRRCLSFAIDEHRHYSFS